MEDDGRLAWVADLAYFNVFIGCQFADAFQQAASVGVVISLV
jgi:hypothetical protein